MERLDALEKIEAELISEGKVFSIRELEIKSSDLIAEVKDH